jgi:hypothetical protein
MLDTARHFIPVPAILDVLDLMSYEKFNLLHLHLIGAAALCLRCLSIIPPPVGYVLQP